MDNLPSEMILQISRNLGMLDITSLLCTSLTLKEIINNSTFWISQILTIRGNESYDNLSNVPGKQLIDMYQRISAGGQLYLYDYYRSKVTGPVWPKNDILQSVYIESHGGFIDSQGSLYVYGNDETGQSDGRHLNYCPQFDHVPKEKFSHLSISTYCSILLTENGHVYVAGSLRSLAFRLVMPKKFESINEAKQVACGYKHTAIVTKAGNLYTFGSNKYGQLGLVGKFSSRNLPYRMKQGKNLGAVKQVACGTYHTAFITCRNRLYVFGRYSENLISYNPLRVVGYNDIKQVACGDYLTVFLTYSGLVYITENLQSAILLSLTPKASKISCIGDVIAIVTDKGDLYISTRRGEKLQLIESIKNVRIYLAVMKKLL